MEFTSSIPSSQLRSGLDSGHQFQCLGDHRHLRRRRKAFERGRKDSVGFGETAGRLIELGERKRREQLEAPGALLFRDSEGGFESVFGLRRVGGITLQKDIAAQSMQVGIVKPIPAFLTDHQSFVDQRQGSLIVLRSSFKPRKSAKKARNYDPIALIPIIRQRFAEVIYARCVLPSRVRPKLRYKRESAR